LLLIAQLLKFLEYIGEMKIKYIGQMKTVSKNNFYRPTKFGQFNEKLLDQKDKLKIQWKPLNAITFWTATN